MGKKRTLKTCIYCSAEYMGLKESKFCSLTCSAQYYKPKLVSTQPKTCPICGIAFVGRFNAKYCSYTCKLQYNNRKHVIGRIRDLVCHYCGKAYRGHYESMYCSKECKVNAKKKGYKKEHSCGYCGKKFYGHFNARYCSMSCKDAYKVRKPSGKMLTCVCCGIDYPETHGKKKLKYQVCSVKCSNIYTTSKLGREVTIEEIERFILSADQQPPLVYVADSLGISNTQVLSKAKAKYGSYRMMIKSLRGTYYTSENEFVSKAATSLFNILDKMFCTHGVREYIMDGLVNPLTKVPLRIDYFLEHVPLAVEYHGEQHFKDIEWFRSSDRKTKWSLKAQRARDRIKANFLKKIGIPLLVFTYKDKIDEESVRDRLRRFLKH